MIADLGKLSRGRLLLTITALATPVALANVSQTLMGLIDTLMVGQLGHVELAAVGVATLLFSAVAMTLKAVDTAVQTFTARRVGGGRPREVGAVLVTALSLVLLVGGVMSGLGLQGAGGLMGLINRDPRVAELGQAYLRWRFIGLVPLLVFFMVRGVFDGIGATRIGMLVGIGMNLVNALLNWLLIFGKLGLPALGVRGAAIASSLAAALAADVILMLALRPAVRRPYRLFYRRNLDPTLLLPFLRLAWPLAVQSLAILLALLIFFVVLGLISTVAVAAGNVVLRIAALSFMPGLGVGVAVQTLVSQALGRQDRQAAVRVGWGGVGLAMILMGSCGLVFLAVPDRLLQLFTTSEELVAAGTPILHLMGLIQLVVAVGLTLAGALRGAGATRLVMMVDLMSGLLLVPPTAYFFGVVLGGGLLGAWLALLLWFSLYAAGMTYWFVRGDWQGIEV
jgi:MATE family multidrug resistance protein